ncbi:MAG: ATP synthase F1 subunit epsilon [Acidobacteriota bacterium]
MADTTFHVSVVTPERAVLETDALFVAFPAHDGEVGILPGRAPLLHQLGMGTLRIDTPDAKHVFFVDGGFAQMAEGKLTLLTEQAHRPSELERDEILRHLKEAREARGSVLEDAEIYAENQLAAQRARAQLRLLDRHGGD